MSRSPNDVVARSAGSLQPGLSRRALLRGAVATTAMLAIGPACSREDDGADARRTVAATPPLPWRDATDLAARLRAGELTPLDALDETIAHIEAVEGRLNAIATRTFEAARERAARPLSGDAEARPFEGVPFLIKDMVDWRGVRRTDGAHALFDRVAPMSPPLSQALEASGFNLLGVTNVPELATLPVTVNERFGATHNPWDVARSPAGSSGGAAAAVAAGYVPIAHATDGSGSIRLPSSCCGVFGFKPSRGRVVPGETHGRQGLVKHHHAISRSVRDSAALLAVTEDRSPAAPYGPIGVVTEPTASGRLPRRLRVGLDPGGIGSLPLDPAAGRAYTSAIELVKALGHEIVEGPPLPFERAAFWSLLEGIFFARMPGLLAYIEARTGGPWQEADILSPFATSFARAALAETPLAPDEAARRAAAIEAEYVAWMAGVDVVLSPVHPGAPPPADLWSPQDDWDEVADGFRDFMAYTALANVTGAPAMSVPLHWTPEGWPIGTQFQARPGDDALLLELAFQLESARPWSVRWPPAVGA